MIPTFEAIVDENGVVRLLEPVRLEGRHRALVTILADAPADTHEAALLSEAATAVDWNRSEEDAAWQHLQPAPYSLRGTPITYIDPTCPVADTNWESDR